MTLEERRVQIVGRDHPWNGYSGVDGGDGPMGMRIIEMDNGCSAAALRSEIRYVPTADDDA